MADNTHVALLTLRKMLSNALENSEAWAKEGHEDCRCWICERLPMELRVLIMECEELITKQPSARNY